MASSQANDDEHDIRVTARQIADYLEQHPKSADTLDGVVNWWLRRQRYTEARHIVEQALLKLIDEHKVERRVRNDGSTLYARSEAKNGEHGDS